MTLVSESQNSLFYQSDLDIDPMTSNVVLSLGLDMVKVCQHTKI